MRISNFILMECMYKCANMYTGSTLLSTGCNILKFGPKVVNMRNKGKGDGRSNLSPDAHVKMSHGNGQSWADLV